MPICPEAIFPDRTALFPIFPERIAPELRLNQATTPEEILPLIIRSLARSSLVIVPEAMCWPVITPDAIANWPT